jgi:ComF family protein
LNWIRKYISGLVSLFYPKFCFACGNPLLGNEKVICTICMHTLPETEFYKYSDNPVEKLFYGRMKVENAVSFLFYDKQSKYGHLLHEFKYKGYREIGYFLGELFGSRLEHTPFSDVDLIVPIPLHFSKLRLRGFNQSEIFGLGLSKSMDKPLLSKALKRDVSTSTQTRKGRFDRWKNVEGIFQVSDPDALKNKHILLIDDVVTTGATLEAAGGVILNIEGTRLSVATMAFAHV